MCEKCSQRILVRFECTPVWTTATAVEKAADGLRDVYRDLYLQNELLGKRKGKEEYLYSAKVHTMRSGMDHTVLPANNTMPAFPSWRSPDVTTTATDAADIQLQLTTHLSTPKG